MEEEEEEEDDDDDDSKEMPDVPTNNNFAPSDLSCEVAACTLAVGSLSALLAQLLSHLLLLHRNCPSVSPKRIPNTLTRYQKPKKHT